MALVSWGWKGTTLKPTRPKTILWHSCEMHCTWNFKLSRGIIRCPDLAGVEEEEIVNEPATQNVIEARRIRVFRDGIRSIRIPVLKFKTAILPKTLKVGYLKVPVILYPKPLQCYRCFKFGHHERQCNADDHCKRCGTNEVETYHTYPCSKPMKCLNCGEEHFSTSRTCKVWKREKEIVTVKYRENCRLQKRGKLLMHDRHWVRRIQHHGNPIQPKQWTWKMHKLKQMMPQCKQNQLRNRLLILSNHKNL